jgi:hypothetical protein
MAACLPSGEERKVASTDDQAILARLAIRESLFPGYEDACLAAVAKLTDQGLLAKVAVEGHDDRVRISAVQKLSDQALLAKVAKEASDPYVRRVALSGVAVAGLSDQGFLAKMAIEDSDGGVRLVAVQKLSDQALLARVTRDASDPRVRSVALSRVADAGLLDQGFLAKTAIEDRDGGVRLVAVRKLSDQGLLAKVALEGSDDGVGLAAIQKLSDQLLLAKLALERKSLRVRIAAVGRLTDQPTLLKLASEQPAAAIRLAAVARVSNHDFLLERSRIDTSNAVRMAAVQAMSMEPYLARVAIENDSQAQRDAAALRVSDPALRRQIDAANRHHAAELASIDTVPSAYYREVACPQGPCWEADDGALVRAALHGGFDVLRLAAARQLDHQDALGRVANESGDLEVCKIIFAKLTDEKVLLEVSNNARNNSVRIAAKIKSQKTTWRDVFDKASARDAGPVALGEALSAADLFPKQEDAREGVIQACLNFIGRGDETRIPELVDLLNLYGDKPLAEDYLNCGQPDLDAAGREWAAKRGYDVGTGAGSHRAAWGSEK